MTLPPFKAAVADLHAFATASLTDALKEIAPGFEKGIRDTRDSEPRRLEPAEVANREKRVD
jgi:hypothetical protein